ncbi:glycosyltransferase family 2 protein [Spirosoma radiotolerans]|uniref:Glycosyl transferase n=1 Tax=Spirosoma radiotolerans TaxID=1379870 RepID=A0A0E3V784_9BACT|nr:glycosyltransferase family 2 protein [Spirosoma radiotolerans]AKD55186.1 glycosyl transferase [Spirosoma radiotolerans]
MTLVYYILGWTFCLLTFLVFYTYLGYGLVAWVLVNLRAGQSKQAQGVVVSNQWPDVTMVVPAYNELAYLPDKLQNCLRQDYPVQHLHFLFVVEGSTDGSVEYLEKRKLNVPNLTILSGAQRLGKIAAMNKAMRLVNTPITIFTDANTELNPEAVSRLTKRFDDETVGAVTGEKRIRLQGEEAAAGSGEGLYWRYESFLKKLDAQLHTIVGAAGELFAIRTGLYEPVEADTLLDDFIISLRIASRGYRVDYVPDAYALERPSHSVAEEMKRKVRIATGGFQAIRRLAALLNIFTYGWLSFQYVSHRVLRWAVTPFCLPLLLLLNGLLLTQPEGPDNGLFSRSFWLILFSCQVAFYLIATVGYALENRQTRFKLTFVPFYFVFMNWCVLAGFARFCNGNLSGVWEKSRRAI